MIKSKAGFKVALVFLLLCVWTIPTTYAADRTEENSIVMVLNNQNAMLYGKSKRLEKAPYLEGNFAMVPLRFISNVMGATMDWNSKDSIVTLKMKGKKIILKPDANEASFNGQALFLDTLIKKTDGAFMVPLSLIWTLPDSV
jgi:hypothetical protein